ncbi:helix-turn-helix transcriptional regulator [Paenibacillus sp. DMB20]|uniref:helix-turn-helix transcriptional regulator n=1 Tax=Paenibacillus sp. DMB20 TaxID=1642570 RepID=UPI000627F712|nr:helix-turn-helix transcriptional regulator [Paenibacillus sp. DMB20]KKO52659.1 AraC family transcriptional regulator [Paenibacillus sp. DMB20]
MKLQLDTWDLDGVFKGFEKATEAASQPNGQDQTFSFPGESGTGRLRRIQLRPGLEMNWFDTKLHEPLTMDVGIHYPHLEISYTISGKGCWEASAKTQGFELSPGVSTFMYIRDAEMHAELFQKEPMLHMELRFDMRHFDMIFPEVERLTADATYCRQISGSPYIPQIVEQMKNCPYSGTLQKLYLEGKALELLTFHLDGTDKETMKRQTASKLTLNDIQCLHEAKSILSRTWKHPPTLLQLARLAGLNDYKLKLGFKELFGTTVFGYVRELRMNEARTLLEQGIANVSETAITVGYHNVSHFASLFRKTFGYNPSEAAKVRLRKQHGET